MRLSLRCSNLTMLDGPKIHDLWVGNAPRLYVVGAIYPNRGRVKRDLLYACLIVSSETRPVSLIFDWKKKNFCSGLLFGVKASRSELDPRDASSSSQDVHFHGSMIVRDSMRTSTSQNPSPKLQHSGWTPPKLNAFQVAPLPQNHQTQPGPGISQVSRNSGWPRCRWKRRFGQTRIGSRRRDPSITLGCGKAYPRSLLAKGKIK